MQKNKNEPITKAQTTPQCFQILCINIRSICENTLIEFTRKLDAVTSMKSNIIIVTEANTTSTSWNRVAAGQLKYQLGNYDSHINENGRRGILILIDRSHNFKLKTIRNINPNSSILEVSDGKNELAIAAIYASSNKDDPEFLLNIREELEKSFCEFNLITGDFNTSMDFKEDTFGYTTSSHWKSRIVLKEWKTTLTHTDTQTQKRETTLLKHKIQKKGPE